MQAIQSKSRRAMRVLQDLARVMDPDEWPGVLLRRTDLRCPSQPQVRQAASAHAAAQPLVGVRLDSASNVSA